MNATATNRLSTHVNDVTLEPKRMFAAADLTGGANDGVNIKTKAGDSSRLRLPTTYLTNNGYTQDLVNSLNDYDYAKAYGQQLRADGVKSVRVGIDKGEALNKTGDYNVALQQFRGLSDSGLTLLVNQWNDGGGNKLNFSGTKNDFNSWQNIVDDTRGISGVIGYELINEPDYDNPANYGRDVAKLVNKIDDWGGKALVVDGTNFAAKVPRELRDAVTSGINSFDNQSNVVWGVHAYPYYYGSGGQDGVYNAREQGRSVNQWEQHYTDAFKRNYDELGGNFSVTEFAASDKASGKINRNTDANTATGIRRAKGYTKAAAKYFGPTSSYMFDLGGDGQANNFLAGTGGSVNQNNAAARDAIWTGNESNI